MSRLFAGVCAVIAGLVLLSGSASAQTCRAPQGPGYYAWCQPPGPTCANAEEC